MIFVRPATCEDADVLWGMLKDKSEQEGLISEFLATPKSLQSLIEQPHVSILIAEFEGAPAGLSSYHLETSTFSARTLLHIEDLYTAPELEGRGIAKTMLTHMAELALGKNYVIQIAPLISNDRQLAWYKKLGARACYDAQVLRIDDVPAFISNLES
jgi:ribosomal protein S18 acetylase RimI-like enzyme